MTREDRLAEIGDYVRYCDAVYAHVLQGLDRGRVRVGLFGFSQGTATVCRWLAQGAARADRLILWGGEIPPDLDLSAARERFSGLELTLVAGRRDQFITSKILERDQARLEAHGIPFRAVTFDGGHEIDQEVLGQVVG
jgi:predicted esterase